MRFFLLPIFSLFFSCLVGCAGSSMDEDAIVSRGRSNTNDGYVIETISPEIIAKLAKQGGGEPPPDKDPRAGTPPPPYTIAPFDVLQVTVWDHPELTLPAGQYRSAEDSGNRVEADGSIFYPHVGVVHVAGKTVAEVRDDLTTRLGQVVVKPQLDVRVAAFRGKRVQVTGEVVAPSTMPLTDVPLRVQDAIAFAKGLTPEAVTPTGISSAGPDASMVTLTRTGKTYHLDMLALYERGDVSQNWLLEDGDVVNVGDRSRNLVFVMGEVKQQQARLMVKRRMTLAQALGDSGGMDMSTARAGRVYVIRGDYRAPAIFRLDARSADALLLATQFQLRPSDVVFVSATELTRWNRVMSQILPTVQLLYESAVSAGIVTTMVK